MELLTEIKSQLKRGVKPINVKIVMSGFRYTSLMKNEKGYCMRKTHVVSGKTKLMKYPPLKIYHKNGKVKKSESGDGYYIREYDERGNLIYLMIRAIWYQNKYFECWLKYDENNNLTHYKEGAKDSDMKEISEYNEGTKRYVASIIEVHALNKIE